MKTIVIIFSLATLCTQSLSYPTSQLYTGTAFTVPQGVVQVNSYLDATFDSESIALGGSITVGATQRLDAKLGYGYLWDHAGPNIRIGPNIGLKWRAIGDGRKGMSLAFSSLFAINEGVGGEPHKNDFAGLVIAQCPIKSSLLILNYGRAFVGDQDRPDIGYFGFAAAREINQRTIVALEYSAFRRLDISPQARSVEQGAAALVYIPNPRISYTLQFADIFANSTSVWHYSLGASVYL